eukprot:scaffold43248_cov62-Phaeocystis_antarctica.AAC.1
MGERAGSSTGAVRGRRCDARARARAGAVMSAEVGGGGRTLGSVNVARKQTKNSPVVPRRRLASASAHLKAAVAVVRYPSTTAITSCALLGLGLG